MIKKKITLSFLRKQDWKKVKAEIKKVNKLLPNILTDNITELNELIDAGMKLVCDKISVPQRNPNRNTKSWMENLASTGKEITTASKSTKEEKAHRDMLG